MIFRVTCQDASTQARCGELELAHGTVRTPAFAPVATRGAVKGITGERLRECGTQLLLANAYHLQLSPGAQAVAQLGGLHAFMAWDGPLVTDSGGYQVFSLARLRRVTDDGVEFRSPMDGARTFLGPREAMRIQNLLGADIAMAFDECPPCPSSRQVAQAAAERTVRWARICRQAHAREEQALFGIVQGGTHEDLRAECAAQVVGIGFDGYAIGGVSVGEEEALRQWAVGFTAPLLPADRPRYLMGVGFPLDLLSAVAQGVDLFDCVAPTRMGRNATAFTERGRLRLRNAARRDDHRPIEEGCDCAACRLYSRAYLNHLFRCHEMLGPILVSLHNIVFYNRLLARARQAIQQGAYAEFLRGFRERYLKGKDPQR